MLWPMPEDTLCLPICFPLFSFLGRLEPLWRNKHRNLLGKDHRMLCLRPSWEGLNMETSAFPVYPSQVRMCANWPSRLVPYGGRCNSAGEWSCPIRTRWPRWPNEGPPEGTHKGEKSVYLHRQRYIHIYIYTYIYIVYLIYMYLFWISANKYIYIYIYI